MMHKSSPYIILHKEQLTPSVFAYQIRAPRIAAKAQAGQFVIIRSDDHGERVPLTIAKADDDSITIVFMRVGVATEKLSCLEIGESILDVAGPLGEPSEIKKFGTVICVAGGFAVAPIVPIAKALKEAGNKIIGILGARSQNLLFWQKEFSQYCDEFIIVTDDGSAGRKGLVTVPLQKFCNQGLVDRVVAIGPSLMMKFCAQTTQSFNIPTIVSLNPIMVDGTGMCGCCRLTVGGEVKITCVDGPEFDGHLVDWDTLLARQKIYADEEKSALEHYHKQNCLGVCQGRL